MTAALGIDGHRIIYGICHLCGQKTAPDELVEPVLLLAQGGLNLLRVQLHMGGTDGLVGVLGPRLGFKLVGACA